MKTNALWEDEDEGKRWSSAVFGILILILLILILFLNTFSLAFVDGDSMTPTLQNKQYALIINNNNVKRGEIVVLSATKKGETKSTVLIKRVIAVGGQSFAFVADSHEKKGERTVVLYFLEGNELVRFDEPYIKEPMTDDGGHFGDDYKPSLLDADEGGLPQRISRQTIINEEITVIKIPKGSIFFMGDNRNDSSDSRNAYGIVSKKAIKGRVKVKIGRNSFLEKLLRFLYGD